MNLQVHPISGGSPAALQYPSKQGHTDAPLCVLLLLAGQGRQVSFVARYIPGSQPSEGGKRDVNKSERKTDRQTDNIPTHEQPSELD